MFNKMRKIDQNYFTDSIFQLEYNLLNIKRELTLMIEDFERQDCFYCFELKCRCKKKRTEYNAFSRKSYSSLKGNKGLRKNAPTAGSLPKPIFQSEALTDRYSAKSGKEFEAWLRTSQPQQKTAYVYDKRINTADVFVENLKRNWNEGQEELMKGRISDLRSSRYAVDTFFKKFEVQPNSMTRSNTEYMVDRITASSVEQKDTKAEYSYF